MTAPFEHVPETEGSASSAGRRPHGGAPWIGLQASTRDRTRDRHPPADHKATPVRRSHSHGKYKPTARVGHVSGVSGDARRFFKAGDGRNHSPESLADPRRSLGAIAPCLGELGITGQKHPEMTVTSVPRDVVLLKIARFPSNSRGDMRIPSVFPGVEDSPPRFTLLYIERHRPTAPARASKLPPGNARPPLTDHAATTGSPRARTGARRRARRSPSHALRATRAPRSPPDHATPAAH